MSARKEANQQRINQVLLADNHLADLHTQRIYKDALFFDAFVEFFDVNEFAHCLYVVFVVATFALHTNVDKHKNNTFWRNKKAEGHI